MSMNNPKIVPIPERFTVSENPQEMSISYHWYKPVFVFLAVFCVFWNGFLVMWYSMGLTTFSNQGDPVTWIFFLFPLIHVAVGIGLIYYTMAGFVNQTTITADRYGLKIDIQPIKYFFGATQLDKNDIKQLYVVEEKTRQKGGDYSYSYALKVLDTQNRSKKLLTLDSLDEARYLENKLESYYKIVDTPIEGEFPKS